MASFLPSLSEAMTSSARPVAFTCGEMRLHGLSALGVEQLEEGAAGKPLGGLVQKLASGRIGLDHLQTIRIDDEDRLRGDLE